MRLKWEIVEKRIFVWISITVLTLSMLNVVFNTMPVAASPRQRALCRNHAKWRAMETSFFDFSVVLRKFQNFWRV